MVVALFINYNTRWEQTRSSRQPGGGRRSTTGRRCPFSFALRSGRSLKLGKEEPKDEGGEGVVKVKVYLIVNFCSFLLLWFFLLDSVLEKVSVDMKALAIVEIKKIRYKRSLWLQWRRRIVQYQLTEKKPISWSIYSIGKKAFVAGGSCEQSIREWGAFKLAPAGDKVISLIYSFIHSCSVAQALCKLIWELSIQKSEPVFTIRGFKSSKLVLNLSRLNELDWESAKAAGM